MPVIGNNIIGVETWNNNKTISQVYQATHDGAGNSLPYMSRSFISFTFGGKAIEDFGLIVVIDGDRMERDAYASFSDLTSNYDTLNGQLYWGSKIEPNKLDLRLATDEITERQLDDFREWFAPEKERELILSEHPNRAIKARVAAAPVFSLLPFEKQVDFKIDKFNYQTSTTVYRGEISISFIMDEPFWYTKLNYMPSYIDKITFKKAEGKSESNKNIVNTLEDKDMIKVMLEDGIPHQSILTEDMFLGGNMLVTQTARVGSAQIGNAFLGVIVSGSQGFPVNSTTPAYLFYSGTAKSYPIIEFSMPLVFTGTYNYIASPANKIQNPNLQDSEYSYISIGDKKFYFTTPSILTAYNQAIALFTKVTNNTDQTELLEHIKLEINEYYVRAWAVKCVIKAGINQTNLISYMRNFFSNNSPSVTFIINSKTGEALGRFSINMSTDVTATNYQTIEQNVGDMIRSDYLTIEGRNYFNSDGEIDLENCKKIQSNESLTNVLVFFQNVYL